MVHAQLNDIAEHIRERSFDTAAAMLDSVEESSLSDQERIVYLDLRAALCRNAGRMDEAEALCRTQLELAEKIFGQDDIRLARVLRNFSMTLDQAEKYSEAIPPAERELAILRKCLPPDSTETADCIVALAKHHYELGRFDIAREMLETAIQRYSEDAGRESLGVATCLNNLGRILENRDRGEEAAPLFIEAAAIRTKLQGCHPDTAFTLLNCGTCLAGLARYAEGAQYLNRCREMYVELGMENSPYMRSCRDNLMICFNAVMTPC